MISPQYLFRSIPPRAVLVAAILTICAPAIHAQNSQQVERFRLAQAYEQNGEPDVASHMYEDLVAVDPRFEPYFDGLARTYLAMKKYDTLAFVTRARIANLGPSLALYSTLGSALFHAGKEKEALRAWDSAQSRTGGNEMQVRRIADDMIASHAYEAALECYARSAAASKNETAFASERANLFMLLSRYREATEEYVKLMLGNQLPLAFVESRLSYFTALDEGEQTALEVVRDQAREHRDVIDLQYLLAWLLMERKQYDEALTVYTMIDEKRGAGGTEVAQFAMRALTEDALAVSYRAFEQVRRTATSDAVIAWAEFGAASVHERLWKRDAPDSIPYARTVAEEFDVVTTKYPKSTWADSAALRCAIIRANVLVDLDGAASRIRGILARNGRLARTGEPDLLLAEIFVARNQLDSAAITAIHVLRNRGIGPDAEQRAKYLLGELRFFMGDFDSAKTILATCTTQPTAPHANDAISLLLMIQENADSLGRESLKLFAAAQLAERRHDHSTAIAGMTAVIAQFGTRSIAENAIVAMGDAYAAAGQTTQSRSAYQRLIDQYPESILCDRAQMRIGMLLEGPLHDPGAAIHAYEVLLQNYPSSILLDDARTRIRALRAQVN